MSRKIGAYPDAMDKSLDFELCHALQEVIDRWDARQHIKEKQQWEPMLKSAIDELFMQYRGKADDIHAENRIVPEQTRLLRVYEDILDILKRLRHLEIEERKRWEAAMDNLRSRARIRFD